MAVSDVGWIVQQTLPVGADINHHGNGACGVNPARGRVNCQFADRHFNAAYAPVADA
jgi:hypothetical protein